MKGVGTEDEKQQGQGHKQKERPEALGTLEVSKTDLRESNQSPQCVLAFHPIPSRNIAAHRESDGLRHGRGDLPVGGVGRGACCPAWPGRRPVAGRGVRGGHERPGGAGRPRAGGSGGRPQPEPPRATAVRICLHRRMQVAAKPYLMTTPFSMQGGSRRGGRAEGPAHDG